MKHLIKLSSILTAIFFSFQLEAYTYKSLPKDFFTTLHILTVNPNENAIVAAKSDISCKRETVMAMAKKNNAIAAINGGFWRENGQPAGILKVKNKWYGTASRPRGAIGWSQEGKYTVMDRVLSHRKNSEDNELNVIPMSLPAYTAHDQWKNVENIIGGAPLLIANGEMISDYSQEQTINSFLTKKRARTAVGIKDSGEWVFVVVDTRFYGFFGGISVKDLTRLMNDLGCTKALNLDGGSSSTMVIEGQIVNNSYGYTREGKKYVQPVSDAILIMPQDQL